MNMAIGGPVRLFFGRIVVYLSIFPCFVYFFSDGEVKNTQISYLFSLLTIFLHYVYLTALFDTYEYVGYVHICEMPDLR